jgi:hypothetical protein
MGKDAPALILDFFARDVVFLNRGDEFFDVVAHEIEFVDVVFFGGVDSDFSGWQTEDEPAVADIDVRKFQNVAQESAISFGVCAVDNRVCAGDHGFMEFRLLTSAATNLCSEFIEHFGVGLHEPNEKFSVENTKGAAVCAGFGEAIEFVRTGTGGVE